MPDPQDLEPDWESRLRSGLRDLGADTPGGGGLPGPDRVRRTHVRRRSALAGVGALAAVVLAGGAVLVLDGPRTSAPVAPTTTTSEPAPTGSAAPRPTTSPTTAPTGAPTGAPTTDPTGDPSPSSPPVSSPTPRPVPTTIPEDYRLPHEGVVADDPWQLVDALEIFCGPHQVDTSGSSDSRVLLQTGPEYSNVEALLVHAEVDDALATMAGARVATCEDGGARTTVTPVPGPWGEAVAIVFSASDETDRFAAYWLLARTGTAVAVVGSTGEFSSDSHPDPDPDLLAALREQIDPIAAELCAYTQAGC